MIDKKIAIISSLAVFVLISVSFVATGITTTETTAKESPLYKIKIRTKLGDKIKEIKTKFFSDRIFLKFPRIEYLIENDGLLPSAYEQCFSIAKYTCNTVLDCKRARQALVHAKAAISFCGADC